MLAEFDAARLDELVAMWRASFEAGVGIKDPHPIAAQKDYFLTQVLPRNSLRIALLEGQLVGFIAASRESIAQLFVRIGFQRRGIGRAILSHLVTRGQAAGFRAMLGKISGDNVASVELHRACGFFEAGRERELGYKFGQWLDVVTMEILLEPRPEPEPPRLF